MRCRFDYKKAWQPIGLFKSLVTILFVVFYLMPVAEAQVGFGNMPVQVMPTEGDMYGTDSSETIDYNEPYEGLDSGTMNDFSDSRPAASGFEENRLNQMQSNQSDDFQPEHSGNGSERIDASSGSGETQSSDRNQASEGQAARENNQNDQQAAKDKAQNEADQAKENQKKADEEKNNQQAGNDRETEEEKRKREQEEQKKKEQGQQAGGNQPAGSGSQAQQPQPDLIYEDRYGSYETAIQQLLPECQHLVQQVDQRCGPANPTMQQATQMIASLGKMPMGTGRESCERFNDAMQSSKNYMNEYVNTCGERKVSCQNTCGQLMSALQHKASFCDRDGWKCLSRPDHQLPQMAQAQQQCGRHAEVLAKAQQDMRTVGTSGGVAEACNKMLLTADSKASGDGSGSGNTASADFDAAQNDAGEKSDKFDLYSDTLMPANNAYIPSVESKANKTNYQKKGNGTGPQVGGSGVASAGYAGQASGTPVNAGGGGGNGKGGVILGYGGRPRGGGGSSFGQGGSGGGSGGSQGYARGAGRGSASTMTAAEAAKYQKGMKLGDYLPGGSRDPQALKLAAYQKSDGITGPTGPTIWTKVSNRYRIHQDSMLPP